MCCMGPVPDREQRVHDVVHPHALDHLERVRTLRRIGDRQVLDRDRQLGPSSEEGHGAESEDRLLLRSREQGVPEQPEAGVGIVLDGDAQPVVLDAAFHHVDGERVDRVLVAVDRQLFQRRERSVPPIGNGERIDHRHDRRRRPGAPIPRLRRRGPPAARRRGRR